MHRQHYQHHRSDHEYRDYRQFRDGSSERDYHSNRDYHQESHGQFDYRRLDMDCRDRHDHIENRNHPALIASDMERSGSFGQNRYYDSGTARNADDRVYSSRVSYPNRRPQFDDHGGVHVQPHWNDDHDGLRSEYHHHDEGRGHNFTDRPHEESLFHHQRREHSREHRGYSRSPSPERHSRQTRSTHDMSHRSPVTTTVSLDLNDHRMRRGNLVLRNNENLTVLTDETRKRGRRGNSAYQQPERQTRSKGNLHEHNNKRSENDSERKSLVIPSQSKSISNAKKPASNKKQSPTRKSESKSTSSRRSVVGENCAQNSEKEKNIMAEKERFRNNQNNKKQPETSPCKGVGMEAENGVKEREKVSQTGKTARSEKQSAQSHNACDTPLTPLIVEAISHKELSSTNDGIEKSTHNENQSTLSKETQGQGNSSASNSTTISVKLSVQDEKNSPLKVFGDDVRPKSPFSVKKSAAYKVNSPDSRSPAKMTVGKESEEAGNASDRSQEISEKKAETNSVDNLNKTPQTTAISEASSARSIIATTRDAPSESKLNMMADDQLNDVPSMPLQQPATKAKQSASSKDPVLNLPMVTPAITSPSSLQQFKDAGAEDHGESESINDCSTGVQVVENFSSVEKCPRFIPPLSHVGQSSENPSSEENPRNDSLRVSLSKDNPVVEKPEMIASVDGSVKAVQSEDVSLNLGKFHPSSEEQPKDRSHESARIMSAKDHCLEGKVEKAKSPRTVWSEEVDVDLGKFAEKLSLPSTCSSEDQPMDHSKDLNNSARVATSKDISKDRPYYGSRSPRTKSGDTSRPGNSPRISVDVFSEAKVAERSHSSYSKKADIATPGKVKSSSQPTSSSSQSSSTSKEPHQSLSCRKQVLIAGETRKRHSSGPTQKSHLPIKSITASRARTDRISVDSCLHRDRSGPATKHGGGRMLSGTGSSHCPIRLDLTPSPGHSRCDHSKFGSGSLTFTESFKRKGLSQNLFGDSASRSGMEHVSPLSKLELSYQNTCAPIYHLSVRKRDENPLTETAAAATAATTKAAQAITSSSRDEDNSSAGGSDLDLYDSDSDSDDEILNTVPVFLQTLHQASTRTTDSNPASQKEISESSLMASDQSDSEADGDFIPARKQQQFKFSLDTLLAEKIEKEEENRELEAMQAELHEGIKQGGFVRLTVDSHTAEDESDLLPEHQQQLRHLEVSEQKIMETHPGELVFQSDLYKHLFSEYVSLLSCGFTPGQSHIDRHLATVQPDGLFDLLTSNLIGLCFEMVSCPDAVLKWLFCIVSVHPNRLVIDGCKQDVAEILFKQQDIQNLRVTWAPALKDILRVFLNYGADMDDLCVDRTLLGLTEEEINEIERPREDDLENRPPVIMNVANGTRLNRENFRLVIQIVALAMQGRPAYSSRELIALTVVLCNCALDSLLVNYMLHYEFQVCLASVFELFQENEWTNKAEEICRHVSQLTTHHHNKVYLVRLLPPGTRGHYLQRRLSYILLCDILSLNQKCLDLKQLKVCDLSEVVPRMRDFILADLYLLASAVALLDCCVGNEILHSSEKNDLKQLTDSVRNLTGEVRDNVSMLDRTKVKDMMVRVTSKWTFMMQSMGSRQPSLFAWGKNTAQKVRVETLSSQQSDSGSDQSDEENIVTDSQPDYRSRGRARAQQLSHDLDTMESQTGQNSGGNSVSNSSMDRLDDVRDGVNDSLSVEGASGEPHSTEVNTAPSSLAIDGQQSNLLPIADEENSLPEI